MAGAGDNLVKQYPPATHQFLEVPGIESFWATLKRAHKGVYHKISERHLNRYVQQFAGKHNAREDDTITQMQNVVAGMVGKRLLYKELTAE